MTTDHADYAVLAARITVSNLHKETKKLFSGESVSRRLVELVIDSVRLNRCDHRFVQHGNERSQDADDQRLHLQSHHGQRRPVELGHRVRPRLQLQLLRFQDAREIIFVENQSENRRATATHVDANGRRHSR